MSDKPSKKPSTLEQVLHQAAAAVADFLDHIPGGRQLAQAAGAGVLLLYATPAIAQDQQQAGQEQADQGQGQNQLVAEEPHPVVSAPGEGSQEQKPPQLQWRDVYFRGPDEEQKDRSSLVPGAGASIICFGMYQDGLECSLQPSFRLSFRYLTADNPEVEDNAFTVSLTGNPIVPLEEGSTTWSAGYGDWTSTTSVCNPGSPSHSDTSCPDQYGFSDVTTTDTRQRERSTYTGMLTLGALYDLVADLNWDVSLGGAVGILTRRLDRDTETLLHLATYRGSDEVARWDQEAPTTESQEVSGLGVAGTAQARAQVAYGHENLGFTLFPARLSLDVVYGGVLNGFDFANAGKEGFEVYEVLLLYQADIP